MGSERHQDSQSAVGNTPNQFIRQTLGPGKAGELWKKCIGIETRLEKAWNDGDYAAIMRKMKNRNRRWKSRSDS